MESSLTLGQRRPARRAARAPSRPSRALEVSPREAARERARRGWTSAVSPAQVNGERPMECYEIRVHDPTTITALARTLDLGSLLADVSQRYGVYDLVAHWTQGEFHHDVVIRLPEAALQDLPGRVLVVATNC